MTKSVKLSRITLATAFMFAGVAFHSNSMAATSKSDNVEKSGILKDGDKGRIKKDSPVRKRVLKRVPNKSAAGRDKGYNRKLVIARQKERIEQIKRGRVKIVGARPKK